MFFFFTKEVLKENRKYVDIIDVLIRQKIRNVTSKDERERERKKIGKSGLQNVIIVRRVYLLKTKTTNKDELKKERKNKESNKTSKRLKN